MAPLLRGRQLGHALLAHTLATLPRHNYSALTLTVTERNVPALHLYQEAGFQTRLRFDALVMDKNQRPPRPFLYRSA